MPNPWDAGSARLLESVGFEALATTSAGFAWSTGKLDQRVPREELVAHVSSLTRATELPLNVDGERCYPDDPGGVTETVALLAAAGAAGFSIENHIRGVDDLDDTIARLSAYRDAGADVVYAPGLTRSADIAKVVALGIPVNVLALPGGPSLHELESIGVRRVSTGSLLAGAAYGALLAGARELQQAGTSHYGANGPSRETLEAAFGREGTAE
jgi:2-methylisocitrate lyase-like PEP mutase family enzyme